MTHYWRLPDGVSAYRALMDASMDERWVDAESNELFIPSEEFKAFSVVRRDKPQGRHQTGDPGRARRNMLNPDALIAQEVRVQADRLRTRVVEVQLGRSAESLGNLVAEWFHLPTLAGKV